MVFEVKNSLYIFLSRNNTLFLAPESQIARGNQMKRHTFATILIFTVGLGILCSETVSACYNSYHRNQVEKDFFFGENPCTLTVGLHTNVDLLGILARKATTSTKNRNHNSNKTECYGGFSEISSLKTQQALLKDAVLGKNYSFISAQKYAGKFYVYSLQKLLI